MAPSPAGGWRSVHYEYAHATWACKSGTSARTVGLAARGERGGVQLVRQAALPERPQAAGLARQRALRPLHDVRVRHILHAKVKGVEKPAAAGVASRERALEQHATGLLLSLVPRSAHVCVLEVRLAAAQRQAHDHAVAIERLVQLRAADFEQSWAVAKQRALQLWRYRAAHLRLVQPVLVLRRQRGVAGAQVDDDAACARARRVSARRALLPQDSATPHDGVRRLPTRDATPRGHAP